MIEVIPYIALVVGVLARVLIPWALEKNKNPDLVWSWGIVWPQLLAGVLPLLGLIAANPDLGGWVWQEALGLGLGVALTGWGAADAGRKVAKNVR